MTMYTDHRRRYLDEINASLVGVIGAKDILWVESPTEEKCFPLIVTTLLKRSLMDTVIKAVIAKPDAKGRQAEKFFKIYDGLSGVGSRLPPALAFIFDDEGRSDQEKTKLRGRGKDRVWFTKRRMYENYLLDAKGITEVLNTTDRHTRTVMEEDVLRFLVRCTSDPKYFGPSAIDGGIDWTRADMVLEDLFWSLADLFYRKTTHSVELTRWILENDPADLQEVVELLRDAFGS